MFVLSLYSTGYISERARTVSIDTFKKIRLGIIKLFLNSRIDVSSKILLILIGIAVFQCGRKIHGGVIGF